MARVFVAQRHEIVFPSFQCFRVDGRKRFEYATCGHIFFFRKRRKSIVFQKYPDTSRPGIREQTVTEGKTSDKKWLRVCLNLSAIISISWSRIPKKNFQVQKDKEKFVVLCFKFSIKRESTPQFCTDGKELYKKMCCM